MIGLRTENQDRPLTTGNSPVFPSFLCIAKAKGSFGAEAPQDDNPYMILG